MSRDAYQSHASLYGVEILLTTCHESVKDHFDHDFFYFQRAETQKWVQGRGARFQIEVNPLSSRRGRWVPLLRTRRTRFYLSPPFERRICFFEKAWMAYSFSRRYARIYCEDPTAAYEAVYFAVLSCVGESLDRAGLHRLHGLGLCWARRDKRCGAILLAPSGGGKSTLAMGLLPEKKITLVSDDTPLISGDGGMWPFPQRIALKERPGVEERYLRIFKRAHHAEKYVVGAEYFYLNVAGRSAVDWLILVKRSKGVSSSVTAVSRRKLIWPLIKWLVLGYETPQIWELYLRLSPIDLIAKTKIFFHRVLTAAALYRKSSAALLRLGTSRENSAEIVRSFLGSAETLA